VNVEEGVGGMIGTVGEAVTSTLVGVGGGEVGVGRATVGGSGVTVGTKGAGVEVGASAARVRATAVSTAALKATESGVGVAVGVVLLHAVNTNPAMVR
jgi:hypothetical protein